jgi:predicted SAM-dependent methyltransferase
MCVDKLCLNLGCGEKTYTFYPNKEYKCINMDNRSLPNVQMVGDARKLEFKDEHFDYILASDIIEHFPISKTENLLKEWSRVLKIGGIMEIRTPNIEWVAMYYAQKRDCKFVSWHIFGGQDYPGNYHYVIFDRALLNDFCNKADLYEVDYSAVDSNFTLKVMKQSN